MNENVFLAASFFPASAAVLIFLMKYISEVLQARVRLGQDESYRAIAAKAATAQAEAAATLASFGDGLADLKSRLIAIERILKDVG